MAMDEALARCLPEGEGVLRIYRWSRPTLSFGRTQPARGRYDPLAALQLGAEVVRRPTGGREVLHDRELTYSVIVPARSLGGVGETHRAVNLALVVALRSLGVAAALAEPRAGAVGLDAGSCFATAVAGEITVQGHKLVGSAQARVGKVLLQHGSVLLGPSSIGLASLKETSDGPEAEPMGITLAELLPGPIAFGELAAAVEAALAGEFGGSWCRGEGHAAEWEVAESLLPHYESSEWTWRR
jgi:lipoyl(octanoyl) transferase